MMNSEGEKPVWKKWLNAYTIALAAALVVLVVFLIFSLLKPSPSGSPVNLPVNKTPNLTLTSPKNEYSMLELIPVEINISSGGNEVAGVDVELVFDPQILEATSSAILKTTLFPEYPLIETEPKEGKIRISAASGLTGNFSGQGTLATVYFAAKNRGQTEVKFNFEKGSTTDSNIVGFKKGEDLLEEVKDLPLMIK